MAAGKAAERGREAWSQGSLIEGKAERVGRREKVIGGGEETLERVAM